MSDNGGIFLKGRVLDMDHKSGTSTKGQAYAFWIISVLTGKTVSEVRWDPNRVAASIPKEGDELHVQVGLDVFNGRQQIELQRFVVAAATGSRVAS